MASQAPHQPARATQVIERRILRDGVYEAVLELLLGNRITPGEALSIDGLARELGVSPTPVREALVQLEHTGLVTRTALKGYRVSPPLSAGRMRELGTARSVLEVAAIRLAVPVSVDVIEALEEAHDQHHAAMRRVMRSVARQGNSAQGDSAQGDSAHGDSTQGDSAPAGGVEWSVLRRYYAVDWDFHLILLRAGGNRYLLEMAQDLAPHVHRLRQSIRQGMVDVEQAHEEHEAILAAVRTGDPDAAADAMARHLDGVAERSGAEA